MRPVRVTLVALLPALAPLPAPGQDIAPPSPPPAVPAPPPPSPIPERMGEPIRPEATPVTPDAYPAVKRHRLAGLETLGADEHSARRLIGLTLRSPSGEARGEIVDILLDETGYAERLVVQKEVPLGVAGGWTETAFAAVDWPETEDEPAVATRPLEEATHRKPADRSARVTVAAMIGADIANRTGQVAGDIVDVILEADGRARLVVFRLAGVAQVGEQLVAVPYSAVERREGTDEYLANLVGEPQGALTPFRYAHGGQAPRRDGG